MGVGWGNTRTIALSGVVHGRVSASVTCVHCKLHVIFYFYILTAV